MDEASAESFPASDPPSWTLGAGADAGVASAVPGMISAPAPQAAVSAGIGATGAGPTPAELVPRTPPLETLLVGAGAAAAAAGLVITLVGDERVGRAIGRAGTTLLLIGLFRRLGALIDSPAGADGVPRSVH